MASKEERRTELQTPLNLRLKVRETSPDRTKVWTEPSNKIKYSDQRVPVIYYLSRNGHLEHPHFMEVPLSSPASLHLRDVINRLNFLRGNGLASMYSWSCKRSYNNGYVWHDLCENDFIYPAHGQEYILKGSEIIEGIAYSDETVTSARKEDNYNYFPAAAVARRRNQSWSAFDFREQKVTTGEFPGRVAANASSETDDRHRRRQTIGEIEEIEEEEEVKSKDPVGNNSSEMSTDETSPPPPPDSSPETLETLIKSDGKIVLRSNKMNEDQVSDVNQLSGRRASTALMQLFSCGSIGFRICGPGSNRKFPHGREPGQAGNEAEDDRVCSLWSGFGDKLKIENKEYFSGSIIETKKKDQFPALKKSSSYNADR